MALKILPVVKAYPVIDKKLRSEGVCVAGISMEEPHQWIRLFPLDYRGLERAQQFRKYEVIEVEAKKNRKDPRPESYTPSLSSIVTGELIGPEKNWRRRLPFFDAVEAPSMCEIHARQKRDGTSLGVFRPAEVSDLVVTVAPDGFTESQRALLDQPSFFGGQLGDSTRKALEPLPVKAKFHYRCNDAGCRGHKQSLIDWELGALYRTLAAKGDDQQTILEKIREKFLLQYCSEKNDTRFITGSMLSQPTSFLVLGLVHPKRVVPPQEGLF
ncbi:MAG: hypothetical protein V9E83_00420 [Baekduia sp.]